MSDTFDEYEKSLKWSLLIEVDMAVEQFAKLQKLDPYRLENMDTYSNLLYVKVCILLFLFECFAHVFE